MYNMMKLANAVAALPASARPEHDADDAESLRNSVERMYAERPLALLECAKGGFEDEFDGVARMLVRALLSDGRLDHYVHKILPFLGENTNERIKTVYILVDEGDDGVNVGVLEAFAPLFADDTQFELMQIGTLFCDVIERDDAAEVVQRLGWAALANNRPHDFYKAIYETNTGRGYNKHISFWYRFRKTGKGYDVLRLMPMLAIQGLDDGFVISTTMNDYRDYVENIGRDAFLDAAQTFLRRYTTRLTTGLSCIGAIHVLCSLFPREIDIFATAHNIMWPVALDDEFEDIDLLHYRRLDGPFRIYAELLKKIRLCAGLLRLPDDVAELEGMELDYRLQPFLSPFVEDGALSKIQWVNFCDRGFAHSTPLFSFENYPYERGTNIKRAHH